MKDLVIFVRLQKKYQTKKNGYQNDINLKFEEIIYELQVNQIELEIQNEELRKTEAKLTASQNRYFEFFELAPIGFFTIDPNGLIIGVNFKGANLLGKTKKRLLKVLLYFS